MPLPPDVRDAIAAIAGDRTSGATTLLLSAIAIIAAVGRDPDLLRETARALSRAQPSMAGFSTACALALTTDDAAGEMAHLEARVRRSASAVARFAAPLIQLRRAAANPLRIVTCSRSATVEETLFALHRAGPLRACCSESRPRREGVTLAASLIQAGVEVELYSDAGLSAAIPAADALVLGADAVSGRKFINKVGTGALAALARACGVPVIVLAGREKIVPPAIDRTIVLAGGPAGEIAPELTATAVRNPYFERVSTDMVSSIVTDGGAVAPDIVLRATLWSEAAVRQYLSVVEAGNMLDTR